MTTRISETVHSIPLLTDIRQALSAPRVACAKCHAPHSALNFAGRICEQCIDRERDQLEQAERETRARDAFQNRRAASGLPEFAFAKTFAGFNVDNHNRHVTRAITRSLNGLSDKGVTIIGLPDKTKNWPGTGNGKTHLLYATVNHLIAKQRWPVFTRMDDLAGEITAEWKSKQDYDPLEKYGRAKYLALDELTCEAQPPAWLSEALNHLLDTRLGGGGRLFVSSNLPLAGERSMTRFFGPRFVSRLQALTTIEHIHGPDRRLT